jgi:hypothetical protein
LRFGCERYKAKMEKSRGPRKTMYGFKFSAGLVKGWMFWQAARIRAVEI